MIPAHEVSDIIDNIGLPNGGFNLAFGDSPTIGVGDGDILISLNPEDHGSTVEYTGQLRKRLAEKFPDVVFFFEAANITNQILNFGLPAPIDVQVSGRNAAANYQLARADRGAGSAPSPAPPTFTSTRWSITPRSTLPSTATRPARWDSPSATSPPAS